MNSPETMRRPISVLIQSGASPELRQMTWTLGYFYVF